MQSPTDEFSSRANSTHHAGSPYKLSSVEEEDRRQVTRLATLVPHHHAPLADGRIRCFCATWSVGLGRGWGQQSQQSVVEWPLTIHGLSWPVKIDPETAQLVS